MYVTILIITIGREGKIGDDIRMQKILIIEDDLIIASSIHKYVESWDYDSHIVEDFKDVIGEFKEYDPDLVLMDITLPFYNGYHWCSEIRKISKVPIVFLSSAADNMNIVMAMNMGGDDFIKKPFDLDVMMAKLQAILRRNYEYAQPMESSCLKYNELVLNLLDACFEYEDNKVELTKNEFKILEVLIRKAGEIVSRDDIMVKLWDTDSFVDENTLTVNVNRLRKKLEKAGAADFIGTKKGMGYYLK